MRRVSNALKAYVSPLWQGASIAAMTGLAALFLSEHYGAPAMLFALLLGMAVSFLYQSDSPCAKGIDFTGSTILRVGIVFLGTRIALGDLITLGWQTALMLAGAIFTTIILGVILARVFGLQKRFGALTGGSVAICGASAALAISSIMPNSEHKERDTLLTVIGVTAMSTIAMILYPIIVNYLEFDAHNAGVFLGGTIHDVAQVVGAGYSVSPETGDIATLTKLVRVAMLLPVVLIMMVIINRSNQSNKSNLPKVPGFLIGFVILMVINSCFSLPSVLLESANELSKFFLITAIAAIGMKTNLGKLTEVGIKPIILIVAETVWIALLILGFIFFN